MVITLGNDKRIIAPGELGSAVSVMDFAPTICALLGVALAESDGSPFLPAES